MTLYIKNDDGDQILFIFDVDRLTPEEIHIEVSTALDKERDRVKELKESASYVLE
jgi:hypothetical protein